MTIKWSGSRTFVTWNSPSSACSLVSSIPFSSLTHPRYSFKVAGALGFDPWQHPTMGTNLREPVPADPRLTPRFAPENTTPEQRATESAELIAEAGVSARRLGVPLTLQDFPRDPAIHSGGENEDPMHAAVPLYGIRAPRWRIKEGLPLDSRPGTATYNGVPAPPASKKGRRLYVKRAQKLNPKWKSFEDATAPSASSSSSSSSSSAINRLGLLDLLDGSALAASNRNTNPSAGQRGNEQIRSATPTMPSSNPPTTTPPEQVRPSLKRTRTAAELENDEDDNVGGGPVAATVMQPMTTNPEPRIKQEEPEPEPQQPQHKRRRRSAAPSPSPSIGLGVDTRDATGGWPGPGQLRRSMRVARAHACATTVKQPASHKRHTTGHGKRATTKS